MLFILPYLSGIILLEKHFLFLSLFLTFPAAFIINKISSKIKLKYLVLLLLIFGLICSGFNFNGHNPYYTSPVSKMISFKNNQIPENAVVITDARIYRGQVAWMFNDRHYLEYSYFDQFMSVQNQSKDKFLADVYYIECSADDCGWGTIKDQPELNSSMEQFSESFKNVSKQVALIKELDIQNTKFYLPFMKKSENNYFTVYKTSMYLTINSLEIIDSTHSWWMYPLGYDKKIGPIWDQLDSNNLLYKLAHLIRTLSVLFAFLSILFIFYFLYQELSENSKSNESMPQEVVN